MGFLSDIDFENVVEPTTVPGDQEYKIRIVGATQSFDKNDNPYLLPRFEVVGEPTVKEFTKFLRLPHSGLDEKQLNNAGFALKKFLAAFVLDPSSLDSPEDLIGYEGWAILGLETTNDWGDQNFVKKFIVPA
jgi:hypothetical protein